MRYLLLVIVALVFLTGVVWWLVFLGNAVTRLFRRR